MFQDLNSNSGERRYGWCHLNRGCIGGIHIGFAVEQLLTDFLLTLDVISSPVSSGRPSWMYVVSDQGRRIDF